MALRRCQPRNRSEATQGKPSSRDLRPFPGRGTPDDDSCVKPEGSTRSCSCLLDRCRQGRVGRLALGGSQGRHFYITLKIWEGNEKGPKAEKRKAPIPIIPHLQKMMGAYRKGVGSPPEGWILTASRGEKPIRMDNLAKREIIPDLKKAGLDWHGWRAFRRGLATASAKWEFPTIFCSVSCVTVTSPLLSATMQRPCRSRCAKRWQNSIAN